LPASSCAIVGTGPAGKRGRFFAMMESQRAGGEPSSGRVGSVATQLEFSAHEPRSYVQPRISHLCGTGAGARPLYPFPASIAG
jgi:hypothetical protein